MIIKRASLPSRVDYRRYLPPVKDQQQCGSCWAFSAIAPLEYLYNKAKAPLIQSFSEQQLVDCVYPRSGCTGGFPATGMHYLNKLNLLNKY
jgi:C1A family cysteine protease